MLDGSVSDYAMALATGNPPPIRPFGASNSDSESSDMDSGVHDHDDDDDSGPSSSPYALAQVTLASKPGNRSSLFSF
jgi:hypothetical protein